MRAARALASAAYLLTAILATATLPPLLGWPALVVLFGAWAYVATTRRWVG